MGCYSEIYAMRCIGAVMFYKLIIIALFFSSLHGFASEYVSISCGEKADKESKIFIFKKSKGMYHITSPFHEVKLFTQGCINALNMIVEIPKGTQEKLEINKSEKFNPLMFDIRDDKIRKISYQAKNSLVAGYPYHYGALPQTWEHVGALDPHTKMYGDNDPVDAFDISDIERSPGDVVKIKVLGAIAMIDNKETDWKVIGINIEDKKSAEYNDITDVPFGVIETIYDFLLNYKTSEGKGQNEFHKQVYWNREQTMKIIKDLHESWQELCSEPEKTKATIEKNRPDRVADQPRCSMEAEEAYKKPRCPLS